MPRYIDADALVQTVRKILREPDYQHAMEDWRNGLVLACDAIVEAPTADVAEVRHGKWKKSECAKYDYFCSVCRVWTMLRCYGNHDDLTKYCPNCGAKMDGERSER